jgi:hypothetical protein
VTPDQHAFDQINLLAAGGHSLYFGPTEEATTYFAARGRPCPSGYNPADHLLEIASEHDPAASDLDSSRTTSRDDAEAKLGLPDFSSGAAFPPTYVRRRNARPVATLMTQFEIIAGRELRHLKRDRGLFAAQVAAACIVGLFVGGLYYKTDTTIGGFQNRCVPMICARLSCFV